jgi:hypothetical protein
MPINANDEIPGGRQEVKPTSPMPLLKPSKAKLVKPGNQRQEILLPPIERDA